MRSLRLVPSIIAPLVASLFVALPVMAQCPVYWQVKEFGNIHQREAALQKEVQRAFNRGWIDEFELAQLQRDLDGARAEDEYFRIDATSRHSAPVMKKLNQIEDVLAAHAADNVVVQAYNIVP